MEWFYLSPTGGAEQGPKALPFDLGFICFPSRQMVLMDLYELELTYVI